LSKEGLVIHKHVDHINPASWHGSMKVSQMVLQTCWKLGRMHIEKDFPFLAGILKNVTDQSFDIFSPLGKNLVKGPCDPDDYNDTVEGLDSDGSLSGPPPASDLEDTVAEENPAGKHSPFFELDGKQIYKAQYLNQAFTSYKKTGSTEHLKRVTNIQRYAAKASDPYSGILERDPTSGKNQVQMDSPVASLVQCDGRVFLCIGEVNDITVDTQHTNHVAVEYLTEPSVFVSYQMLYLVPATVDDDTNLKHDWQWSGKCAGSSNRVLDCLVQPINPSLSTCELRNPFYLFESSVLMAVRVTIFERLESRQGNLLTEVRMSGRFPYREDTGNVL
jgi:hypothetical protein